MPYVSEREEPNGCISFIVNGLQFARWRPGDGLVFGIETKYKASESNLPEIEALAREFIVSALRRLWTAALLCI